MTGKAFGPYHVHEPRKGKPRRILNVFFFWKEGFGKAGRWNTEVFGLYDP
jgi:hypothetical protein